MDPLFTMAWIHYIYTGHKYPPLLLAMAWVLLYLHRPQISPSSLGDGMDFAISTQATSIPLFSWRWHGFHYIYIGHKYPPLLLAMAWISLYLHRPQVSPSSLGDGMDSTISTQATNIPLFSWRWHGFHYIYNRPQISPSSLGDGMDSAISTQATNIPLFSWRWHGFRYIYIGHKYPPLLLAMAWIPLYLHRPQISPSSLGDGMDSAISTQATSVPLFSWRWHGFLYIYTGHKYPRLLLAMAWIPLYLHRPQVSPSSLGDGMDSAIST